MIQELFRIPFVGISISPFGVLMLLAFAAGWWITAKRMREVQLDPELVSTLVLYIVIGGIGGAKLYFAVDNWLLGRGSLGALLLNRAGVTWYGGLIGGTLAAALGCRANRIPFFRFADAIAPALAVGQAIGRVGCFLVGDDYGRASALPWAVAFPHGSPPTRHADGTLFRVHPTQLYEIVWLLPVAAFLWWRRDKSPFLFGEYLALNGLGRIVIESWRVNPRVALGLTEPQWIGLGLVALGATGWLVSRHRRTMPAAAARRER